MTAPLTSATLRPFALVAAMALAVVLSPVAGITAEPPAASDGEFVAALPAESAVSAARGGGAARSGWETMMSRDPYPAMGVGTTHRAGGKRSVERAPDRQAWEAMVSRDPYPAMGVGSHR